MNEQELMKFVIERSNDPIIKNPVLRDAMNKDLGPRNNYFAGTLVKAGKKLLSKTPTPKPKPIKPSILKRETIPLNLTQVNEISKNKEFEQAWKNYKISIRKVGRRKFNKDQFFEIWARENMAQGGQAGQLVSNTVDGSRPGYAGDETFLVKVGKPLKVNNVIEQEFIEVTGSKNRPETYKKTGVKKTLYKPQIVVGNKTVLTTDFGTKDAATTAVEKYRIKNPIKNAPPDLDTLDEKKKKKYLDKRERSAKISKQGGVESFETGNKTIHKGHSQNIDNPDVPIKPSNIIYTPQKINQSMAGAEGKSNFTDLDYKIDVAEDKIRDIKKSNMSGAKKKVELEKLDTKLMKYVDDSNGYKTVTLSGGNTYGEIFQKSKSMDMFDEFPDKTEKETKKFVNQYFTDEGKLKDKWTKGNISSVDKANIQKSYVFLENIKNAKTNAKQTKFIDRMMTFCPAGSKRVKKASGGGAGPTCSLVEAKAGMKKQAELAAKASKDGKIPKKFGKLRSFMTNVFGLADVPIETLLVLPEITAGNTDAAIQNSTLGWFTDKGEFNLEKLKDSNFEAYQFLKDKQAQKEFIEAEDTLDSLQPFLDKAQAEGKLNQVDPEILNQYRNAKNKRESIMDEYEDYGYAEGDSKSPLTGKVATQQYLRDKVKSDWQKRQDRKRKQSEDDYKSSGLEFDKDPNQKQFQYEDVYKAPTDLKSFIEQKGELGKDTMLQYGVRKEADRIGAGGIFDNFVLGMDTEYAGGKDIEDLYSELPIEYASQLASLEKEQLEEGLRAIQEKEDTEFMSQVQGAAHGGIMNLRRKK
jgi:hypothetical protein